MAAGDLTTTADVKAFAGISGSGGDAVIALLITAASTFIADFTDRSFTSQATVNEIRDGSGGTEMFLPNGPVGTVSSLTINGVSIPQQSADGQPGWFLSGDTLCLYGYCFTRGRKNVRVTYTGGYASAPADVVQACKEMVASAYNRGKRGVDVQSETVEAGQTYSFAREAVPKTVLPILQRYQKVVPA